MLSIFLNWLYILFTTFCIGFAFSVFVEKKLHYKMARVDSILITGFAMATVYAQIVSLFFRVNIEANICLTVLSLMIAIVWRKQIYSFLKQAYRECTLIKKVLIIVLLLAWCYFTSRGYMTVDTDLYHAQSIRWIEEYGVVKGLGNLHSRFAYNSSVFAVSALYSMKFICGRSLHAVNGFLAFVLSIGLLDLGKCFQRRKMLLSDFARVGAVYYLTLIWDEIIAPSSDYAITIVLFIIVIKWLTQLEDSEKSGNIAPYSLLCVLGVYALTLKLTAGLILLLLVKPAYTLLKEKRWKEIMVYLVLGLVTAAPWVARTVIISGWLLYPFPAIDLFAVDWKMKDIYAINTDAELIKAWAKAANTMGINAPLSKWFPHWFSTTLSFTHKLTIVGDLISCVLLVITAIRIIIKKLWKQLDILIVLLTILCSYLYWQFTAPMPRYGYAYMLLLVTLTLGYLLQDKKICTFIYVFLIIVGLYKLYVGVDHVVKSRLVDAYVWQEDYTAYELAACEVDGVIIYYSPTDGCTGYDPFPSCGKSIIDAGIELRGEGLKDGFRMP